MNNTVVPSIVIQEYQTPTGDASSERIKMMIVSINCAGKTPDKYQELLPVFERQMEGVFEPDIIVVGLQEIVKLNALSVFQGKSKSKMNEWEKLLKETIG